jgi:hypothetical protein
LFRFEDAGMDGAPELVDIDASQARLVEDLTTIIGPAIGLETARCRALILRAVGAWEAERRRPAKDISAMRPRERARAALEVRDHIIVFARALLRTPDERVALSSAIEDAFAHYMKKYNRRRP